MTHQIQKNPSVRTYVKMQSLDGATIAGFRRGRLLVANAEQELGAQYMDGTARGVQQEQLDEEARGEDKEHLDGAEKSRRVSNWIGWGKED